MNSIPTKDLWRAAWAAAREGRGRANFDPQLMPVAVVARDLYLGRPTDRTRPVHPAFAGRMFVWVARGRNFTPDAPGVHISRGAAPFWRRDGYAVRPVIRNAAAAQLPAWF